MPPGPVRAPATSACRRPGTLHLWLRGVSRWPAWSVPRCALGDHENVARVGPRIETGGSRYPGGRRADKQRVAVDSVHALHRRAPAPEVHAKWRDAGVEIEHFVAGVAIKPEAVACDVRLHARFFGHRPRATLRRLHHPDSLERL